MHHQRNKNCRAERAVETTSPTKRRFTIQRTGRAAGTCAPSHGLTGYEIYTVAAIRALRDIIARTITEVPRDFPPAQCLRAALMRHRTLAALELRRRGIYCECDG